jgi:lipopolysaccharide biosynthesis glycosyltransferase
VARRTLRRHAPGIPIHAIELSALREAGLYTRTMSIRDGRMWDDISGAPQATEFAISRFLTPHLARTGWALFVDCDVMARANVQDLFAQCDPSKAVMCVQHNYVPKDTMKMDGQLQMMYKRKNWTSVMAINCDHPANKLLTVEKINELPGRDLHALCWLKDRDIGKLDPAWNFLVGESDPKIEPKIVHFTNGVPSMLGYDKQPYADEWFRERSEWLNADASVLGRPTTWAPNEANQWL